MNKSISDEKVVLFFLTQDSHIQSVLNARLTPQYDVVYYSDEMAMHDELYKRWNDIPVMIGVDHRDVSDLVSFVCKIKRICNLADIVVLGPELSHNTILNVMRNDVSMVFDIVSQPQWIDWICDILPQHPYPRGVQNYMRYTSRQHKAVIPDSQVVRMQNAIFNRIPPGIARSEIYKAPKDVMRGTVLIVDDEADIRAELKYALKRQYTIFTAGNGQEAIDMISENMDIQIVLLDIRMPVMTGAIALPIIREKRPDIQIVVLTAFDDTDIVLNGFDKGIHNYVNKGDSVESVIATVDRAMTAYESEHWQPADDALLLRMSLLKEFVAVSRYTNTPVTWRDIIVFFPSIELSYLDVLDKALSAEELGSIEDIIKQKPYLSSAQNA